MVVGLMADDDGLGWPMMATTSEQRRVLLMGVEVLIL
jgi:hypothetical protein